jgi:hypothetical protein
MLRVLLAALRHLSVARLLSSLLQAFGVLWLFVEATSFFSPEFSSSASEFWLAFLVAGGLVGLARAWPRLSVSAVVAGTDCSVTIRVCDLFSLKNVTYVVSTNTTFDTAMDDGTIHPSSVQGQFTKKFVLSRDQLDRDIAHSLQGLSSEPLSNEDKPYGKLQRYEVGTVASVLAQTTQAHLVAIATLNAHRVAQATARQVADALPRLWEHVRTRGNLDILCCPILGSGFSRLNATREALVHEMVRSFIPAVRAGAFCRSLIIAVSPRDFREGHLDLERLSQFLQHECTYGSSALGTADTTAVGTQA